ncbi:MAG TPA: Crp/Fnr family transcriptional regulator [Kiloniellales bacterium]|jgi:CRP-like cAMP-binding protein|nr:Crp/Fnr family transcriptional regulator [Kiloniellales bacterium]
MRNEQLRESLKGKVPLFEGLPEEALDEILKRGHRHQLAKGFILFHQGEPADSFHLIIAGRLKVAQTSEEGQQMIVRYLGPRELAGCVAVCGGLPYPATATAVEDTWLLQWNRGALADVAERWPQIALNAMRIMGGRTQELQDRVRELQGERVEQRIARTLGRLVVQAGRRTADGIEIDFPLSRQDLAEMVGTTLHTVSRTLAAWEQEGIVRSGRQKVMIRDAASLSVIAGSGEQSS